MRFIGKILAQGKLPDSIEDLYEVPSSVSACFVKYMSCLNTDVTMQEVKIFINGDQISNAELGENESKKVIGRHDAIALSAGDKIRGYSTDADKVSYVISGVEQRP